MQVARHVVETLSAKQGHEIIIATQCAKGLDDKEQSTLSELCLFDEDLLAVCLLSVDAHQSNRAQGALGPAPRQWVVTHEPAGARALFENAPHFDEFSATQLLFVIEASEQG